MLELFETAAKAIGDPSRVRILKLLEGGELCVCQIIPVLGLAPATVSKHLAILKAAGLVRQRKQGRWIHYRLADHSLNPYAPQFLALVRASLGDDPAVVGDRQILASVAVETPSPCDPEPVSSCQPSDLEASRG
jgi:DNA-binding transcriptional ArsR family regulator